MSSNKYPTIGTEVDYIRATEGGEVHWGKGIVKAIHLDPRSRIMVNVMDLVTGDHWNVDFVGVNPPDGMRERYEATIAKVVEVSAEGNDLIKKTQKSYSEQVDAIYTELLGAPVHIDPVEIDETEGTA